MKQHPIVLFVNLCLILAFTMCSMNPYIVFLSYGGSLTALILFNGSGEIKNGIKRLLFFLAFSLLLQGLFSHNGKTAFFYINHQPVTAESLWFGVVMAFLLLSGFQWFIVFGRWMSTEHIMYLFGRAFPKAALLLSMIFRFLPLMKRRFRLIEEVRKEMGGSLLKSFSVLAGWSLEASIETADSMAARGYGTGRRTSFHRFSFHIRDGIYLFFMLSFGMLLFHLFYKGFFLVYFYPGFWISPLKIQQITGILCFALLMVSGIIYEIRE